MRAFPRILLKNWWVFAFVLMAWSFYLQATYKKNRLMAKLEEKIQFLDKACLLAREEKEELLLRIQSQDDPEWMELVLKEKLGVVPEGQIKVVFE